MNNRMYIVIFVVCTFLMSSLLIQVIPVQNTNILETEVEQPGLSDDQTSKSVQANDESIKITKLSNAEINELTSQQSNDEGLESGSEEVTRTRSSVRESPDWPNTHTNAHSLSGPGTVDGIISGSSDEDWFKIHLKGDTGSGGNVENLSITVTSLIDNPSWADFYDIFQLFIFGTYSHGGPFENNDLVFMDAQGFRPRNSPSIVWPLCFARAYKTGDYYIMAKADFDYGSSIDYSLDINIDSVSPPDHNQVPESGDIAPPPGKDVDQGRDLFDWYKIDSPTGKSYPLNFTFKLDLKSATSTFDDKTHFPGKTVHFYCEVIVVVFHNLVAPPIAVMKVSQSGLFDLNRTAQMTENTTELVTYVGVYVQMYGRTTSSDGPYYFAGKENDEDKHMGGVAKYNLFISVDWIIKPLLSDEVVMPYKGRTYDDYVYQVTYKDENNHPPLDHQIQVDERPIEEMKLVSFVYTKNNYKEGAVYEYTINGVKLGEGLHSFKFIFKDNDGFAERAMLEFDGSYISDNVAPQVRITSVDSIQMEEDCGDRYVDLLEVFDDVDNDFMTFTVQQGTNWVSDMKTGYAAYSVRSNNTLRITPNQNKYGADIIYINATDIEGNWVEVSFEFTVNIAPINDPPQIKEYLGERTINEDTKLMDINLNKYFWDPIEPDQKLSFDFEPVENIKIVLDAVDGNIIITPEDDWNGEAFIRFSASDGYSTIYNVLRLNVKSINDPPIFFNPRGFTIQEGVWFHLKLVAYDSVDNEEVHIETDLIDVINTKLLQAGRISTVSKGGAVMGENIIIEPDPTNESLIIFSIKPTNEMSSTPESSYSATYTIDISAVDESGASKTYRVDINIINMNDKPQPKILRPLNGSVIYAGDFIHFIGDAGDPDVIHSNLNTYKWSSNIEGELGKGKYLNNKQINNIGLHTITLEVGDGEAVNRTTIEMRVKDRPKIDIDGQGDDDKGILSGPNSNLYMMSFSIIALVILFILATILSLRSKKTFDSKMSKEIKPEELKLPEEVQTLLAPQKVVCSHCSTVLSVVSKQRPLSVTCEQCGNKSVIYYLDIHERHSSAVPKAQPLQQPQMGVPTSGQGPQYMLPSGENR